MKGFSKFLTLPLVAGIFFVLVSPSSANAAVDIELVENEEDSSISILVDSNDSYVDGMSIEIFHPEDVVIDEENVVNNEEYCTIGYTVLLKNTFFSVECFNDLNTVMDGEIMRIPFSTDSNDYFFYIDQDTLNIGVLTLGEITDINRPDNILFDDYEEDTEVDTALVETEEKEGIVEDIRTFLTENTLYVLIGVVVILLIAIIVVFTRSSKEETQAEDKL